MQPSDERKHAALTVMVGIQHKTNILEGNQQEQCPENQRDGSNDMVPHDRHMTERVCPKENLPEGVEDGGPNISIDHPAGLHDQERKSHAHHIAPMGRRLVGSYTSRAIKPSHRSSFQISKGLVTMGYNITVL
jgi:hypothetical protein